MRRAKAIGLVLGLLLLVGLPTSVGAEEEVAVPVQLQMELLVKVAAYDKNLPARAPDKVRLLIVTQSGSAQSSRTAQQAARALAGKMVANLPLEIETMTFSDSTALAKRVSDTGVDILYLTPGFSPDDLKGVGRSLDGVSVLSAGALASFVQDGVVLSFDLVGGKPKLLVHLRRARGQKVDLSSQILKLVKVIE